MHITCSSPQPQSPIIVHPRLINIIFELTIHVSSWTVLADQICAFHASVSIVIALDQSATDLGGILPDELGEVAVFFGEFSGFVGVGMFFFAPGVDGEGWGGEVCCEVFAVWAALGLLLVDDLRKNLGGHVKYLLSASKCNLWHSLARSRLE